jgi:hypothetical protein
MIDEELMGLYRAYKNRNDLEAGKSLARSIYYHLNKWNVSGRPDGNFSDEFWRLFGDIDETTLTGNDLIDLGLMQTAEALSVFRENDGMIAEATFYLNEAMLPFYAFFEEISYRHLKNVDFSEIDFQIFDIIGGEFPHEAAQEFLIQNDWVDIWLTFRYLETIDDISQRIEIIEKIMHIRETVQEKLIFLSYAFTLDHHRILDTIVGGSALFLPSDMSPSLILAVHDVIGPFLETGVLDTGWEYRMRAEFERETVFTLLAMFEITQAPLNPGWVRVLEKGTSVIWDAPIQEAPGSYIPQPIQEFTGSILGFLPEEETALVMDTSLVIPLFIENLHRYSEESFHDLLSPIALHPEPLYSEIELNLYRYRFDVKEKKRFHRRLKKCAARIGYDLLVQNGNAFLSKKEME